MSLLALAAILGWALIFARWLPGRPGAAIFVAHAAIISILYALACLGQLWLGATLLFWVGNAALLGIAVRQWAFSARLLTSVPCVIFVFYAAGHWFLFSEAQYYFWDEFSQWGLVAREMLATHELYGLASNAIRPTAPPAAALWHYFVCANTSYSEGATFSAQFLLLIAPLLPFYERLSFRKPGWIALVAALQLLLLANLGHATASVFVDSLISTVFTGILFVHVTDPKSRRTLALLVLPLFVLALLKESGAFFSVTAAFFLIVHHLTQSARNPADALRQLRSDRRCTALLCLVALAPAIAVGSWQLQRALLPSDEAPTSFWGVGVRALSPTDSKNDKEALTKRRFLEVFLEQPMSRSRISAQFNTFNYTLMSKYKDQSGLSTLGWLLVFMLASGLAQLCVQQREKKRSIVTLSLYLLGVFALYALIMLRTYSTEPGHGHLISSYVRYTNTLLLPLVLLSLAWFLPAASFREPEPRSRACAAVLTALLVALYAAEPPYRAPLYKPREPHVFREGTQRATEKLRARLGANHSLFVYFPKNREGVEKWSRTFRGPYRAHMLKYQLTPIPTTIGTSLADKQALDEALSHDYVWIFASAPELNATIRSTIGGTPAEANVLYRVRRSPDEVALIPFLRLNRGKGRAWIELPSHKDQP